jgi:hypothetical protein
VCREQEKSKGLLFDLAVFPSTVRILACSIPVKMLGNARKPKSCMKKASGSLRSPVHMFALYSPILFLCGTCPNPSSAPSPFGARDAARPSPRRSKRCQTLGLLPTVRCAASDGATCRQRFSGAHCRISFNMGGIAWWCANG